MLLDCTNHFGYRTCPPRGLLREPLDALQGPAFFILTKSDQVNEEQVEEIRNRLEKLTPGIPVICACHRPSRAVAFTKWMERNMKAPFRR